MYIILFINQLTEIINWGSALLFVYNFHYDRGKTGMGTIVFSWSYSFVVWFTKINTTNMVYIFSVCFSTLMFGLLMNLVSTMVI